MLQRKTQGNLDSGKTINNPNPSATVATPIRFINNLLYVLIMIFFIDTTNVEHKKHNMIPIQ